MTCPRCSAPADEQTLREFGGVCPKCLLDFSEEQDAPAFPNLEILEMIGQGGMGVVYKAKQKNLDRIVALKVLSPQLSDDPEFVERFTREAKALAQLSHPNIVGIHDSGIHDRVPYLVMEYIDGTPLRKMMAGAKLTPARALEVIPQICDALQYAHTHGVVHRDIKPENILIDRQGRVKIADFGLAKLSKVEESRITQSGYVMGTPRYMAPEQFEATGRVDHRADIYSLGVVFYEMLTGEVPMGRFKPPSAKADVDRRLDPVVLKSLEREPDDRYQSAGEVKDHVANLGNGAPRPPRESKTPGTAPSLRKAAGVIMGMGALALLFGVLLAWADVAVGKLFFLVGGSILVAAVVLWLISHFFRSEPDPAVRREGLHVGGCLVALVSMIVGVIALFLLLFTVRQAEMPAAVVEPPPPVAIPDPVPRHPEGRLRHLIAKQPFDVETVWPDKAELGEGFSDDPLEKDPMDLAKLPAALRPDLEDVRVWRYKNDAALMVGFRFRSELARRRWEKEGEYQRFLQIWDFRLSGEAQSVILIRHDGTPLGEAAKEILEAKVQKRWIDKVLNADQPRKK
jgi:predicted Ser/Thr protein kinase